MLCRDNQSDERVDNHRRIERQAGTIVTFELYIITCSMTHKQYVGITSSGLRQRWVRHLKLARVAKPKQLIHRVIKKYGAAAFNIKITGTANSWKGLCEMERAAIAFLNTKAPNGYNLTGGGEGQFGLSPSPDTIAKLRAFNMGKVLSLETRLKMRNARRGMIQSANARLKVGAAQRGKIISAEHRRIIAASNRSRKVSAMTRFKMSESQRRRYATEESL